MPLVSPALQRRLRGRESTLGSRLPVDDVQRRERKDLRLRKDNVYHVAQVSAFNLADLGRPSVLPSLIPTLSAVVATA
jgi:hypothetical protein